MYLIIESRAKAKSTHSIQYVPLDEELAKVTRDKDGFEVMNKETKESLELDDIDLV